MNTEHLTNEELIDILITGKDDSHLEKCSECIREFNFIKNSIDSARKGSGDTFNSRYGTVFFAKQKGLFFERYDKSLWRFYNFFKPLMVGFASLLLVFGIYSGHFIKSQMTVSNDMDDEKILQTVDNYIEETEVFYYEETNFD